VLAQVLVFDVFARAWEAATRSAAPERLHRSLPDRHLPATSPLAHDRRQPRMVTSNSAATAR
jgi:hypothetical protein